MMKILMLLDNPFVNDRRVYREAKTLVDKGYELILLAVQKKGQKDKECVDGINVERIISPKIYDIKDVAYKQRLVKNILTYDFNILHCHDQEMLNIGVKIKSYKKNIFLIYDSHELFYSWPLNLSNYDNKIIALKSYFVRKIQIQREKYNIKKANKIITVNYSIAKDLMKHYSVNEPVVIRNIPERSDIIEELDIRKKLNIYSNQKILVFIGANIYRKTLNIEQVFAEFSESKDVVILIIAKNNQNRRNVEAFVKQKGYNNVLFHDAVPPNKISAYLKNCDVGLVPTWNKKDKSYWYALDNKLFEYMHSGIPILATCQPEYKKIVCENRIGITINPENNNAYLDGFNKIISNYSYYKKNTYIAARKLNWEHEKFHLLKLYSTIKS